ncbi:hypothetical protein TWF718_007716 [Orbilia javanica]|uniref:Uncharacterized protein n=1 Tax=Orbilia javanica TaxID=47235 RepID=A0AAN8RCK1_9PEZI
MFGHSRFNLLIITLVSFVSFVTSRTVLTSQTCATRYCNAYVPSNKIHKVTKTVHKSARYTVTRWKTVSKPKSTRTVTVTKTTNVQKYRTVWLSSTTTSLVTKWIGTTTHVRTVHATTTIYTSTITLPVTTFTITHPYVVVPVPSGFVGIDSDPDNVMARYPPEDDPWLSGRSAEPEPEPEPKPEPEAKPEPVPAHGKYVTAITCTKFFTTKTGTSDLWKTTTKAGATTTKTVITTRTIQLPLLTLTKSTTQVIPTYTSKYKVAFASSIFTRTLTSYTDATTYLSTATNDLPVPTYYAACGVYNKAPHPEYLERRYTIYNLAFGDDENIQTIWFNGTSHDCCAKCHTWDQGGACIGSVWRAQTWWGEQPCRGPPVGPEECPEFTAKCDLIIASSSAPDQCRSRYFDLTLITPTLEVKEGIVSNGPACKAFKFAMWW